MGAKLSKCYFYSCQFFFAAKGFYRFMAVAPIKAGWVSHYLIVIHVLKKKKKSLAFDTMEAKSSCTVVKFLQLFIGSLWWSPYMSVW